jgi:hypothetical protein
MICPPGGRPPDTRSAAAGALHSMPRSSLKMVVHRSLNAFFQAAAAALAASTGWLARHAPALPRGGRWQLQLRWRRPRHTCLDQFAHRRVVHSAPGLPRVSALRLSACSIARSWLALSLDLRPARPACFNPARLDCASCHIQRITDCRWPPKRRATSLWLTSCLSHSAAFIRRRSSALKSRRAPAALPILARLAIHVSILYKIEISISCFRADTG